MTLGTLPPVVWLDTSQAGSGLASDNAARNLSNAKSAADGLFLAGPILVIDRAYTLDDTPTGYILQGFGEAISTLTGSSTLDSDGAAFCSFKMTGDFDDTTPAGPWQAINCQLHDVRGQFNARRCRVSGTLKPVDACILEDCHFANDESSATSAVVIDLTNCTALSLHNCTGRIEFVNRNSASGSYYVNGGDGIIAFKSTLVQWATFVLRGAWEVVERANGASAVVTDYSDGRARALQRGQALGNFFAKQRGTLTVNGAQTLADTSIETTTSVIGAVGDAIMVRNTGECMLVSALSGTTYTVTRGAFGTVPQPIANGEQITIGQPLADVVTLLNLLISATGSLLGTISGQVAVVDAKVDVVDAVVDSIQVDTNSIEAKVDLLDLATDTISSQVSDVLNELTILPGIQADVVLAKEDTARILNTVRALASDEAHASTTSTALYGPSDTSLVVASADAVRVGDLGVVLNSGEVLLVTAVDTGTDTLTVTRGQLLSTAISIASGGTLLFLRREDVVTRIVELFVNDAETVVGGGGERTVTIFEVDGTTPRHEVEISSDGLTRTRNL